LRREGLLKRAKSIVESNHQLEEISNRLSGLISNQINLKLSETNQKIQWLLVALTVLALIISAFNFF